MPLTYKEFIELTNFDSNTIFCKILSSNNKHNIYQYTMGLNENNIMTDHYKSDNGYGFTFTTNRYLSDFTKYDYGESIAIIKLCKDAYYYIDRDERNYTTNKFIIIGIYDSDAIFSLLAKQNDNMLYRAFDSVAKICKSPIQLIDDALTKNLKYNMRSNKYISHRICEPVHESCYIFNNKDVVANELLKDQSEKNSKMAVRYNGLMLQLVKNQTDEICKLAVKQNGYALKHVINQTEEICELAVQQNGYAIIFVKIQTDKIRKLAVQQNGLVLKHIHKQTDEICKIAVQQNGLSLQYVKYPNRQLRNLAIKENALADHCVNSWSWFFFRPTNIYNNISSMTSLIFTT